MLEWLIQASFRNITFSPTEISIFTPVFAESDDPLTKLNDYTRFLAWARQASGVVWTSQYEDSSGLGSVVTAAAPVYSPDARGPDGTFIPGTLVAVVGHDARISQFEEAGADPDNIVPRLSRKNAQCTPFNLTDCQFQVCA